MKQKKISFALNFEMNGSISLKMLQNMYYYIIIEYVIHLFKIIVMLYIYCTKLCLELFYQKKGLIITY